MCIYSSSPCWREQLFLAQRQLLYWKQPWSLAHPNKENICEHQSLRTVWLLRTSLLPQARCNTTMTNTVTCIITRQTKKLMKDIRKVRGESGLYYVSKKRHHRNLLSYLEVDHCFTLLFGSLSPKICTILTHLDNFIWKWIND